ncbi:peptidyl-prolyl cis-trans isomerase [Haloferula chungangensis]|uniref:peptidylprolyl isomerase n=1 Tax=Haloferula chungangensis TaxID=1048331 RepID=A0ABW2L624_9BACT
MVHFFLIAAVLLSVSALVRSRTKPLISLDESEVEALVIEVEKDRTRPETEAEPEQLVRSYLRDEVLYREALDRGLTDRDEVREVLIHVLKSELTPVLREPSDEELLALRKENSEEFLYPPKISFEHVSYSVGSKSVPENLLSQLKQGEDPAGHGERVALANPLPPTYKAQLDRVLGVEASEWVFSLPVGEWSGPVESRKGVHFIRVIEKESQQEIPFDRVRDTLRSNWAQQRIDETLDDSVREMANGYRFEVPDSYQKWVP